MGNHGRITGQQTNKPNFGVAAWLRQGSKVETTKHTNGNITGQYWKNHWATMEKSY
jgi:hypothetical protein